MAKRQNFVAAAQLDKGAGTTLTAGTIITDLAPELLYDYSQVENPETRAYVRSEMAGFKLATRRTKESILEMGRRLANIKDAVPFGQFQDMVRVETSGQMSDQTARNYMNVWERFGNQPETLDLFTPGGLYLLAQPTMPEPVRDQIIDQAQQQGGMSQAEVKEAIAAQKPDSAASSASGTSSGGTSSSGTSSSGTSGGTGGGISGGRRGGDQTKNWVPATVDSEATTSEAIAVEEPEEDPAEIARRAELAGHIAILKRASETALWYANRYGDTYSANNLIRACNTAIHKMGGDPDAK